MYLNLLRDLHLDIHVEPVNIGSGKDMEFTILSKHSQHSLFKLSLDGKLEALDSVSIGFIFF